MVKTFDQYINENYLPDGVNGALPIRLANYKGEFLLNPIFDIKKNEKSYRVYYTPTTDARDAKIMGEYFPQYNIDDEWENFVKDFTMWVKRNMDIVK